jgi:drug/metabolite transporter (DMT)-like permease
MALLPTLITLFSAFLHAGWNLIAREHRNHQTFLKVPLVIAIIGLIPAIIIELAIHGNIFSIWWCFLTAGCFQAIYFWALMNGYQSGDFTVVYPLARALPVILLAVSDIFLGYPPNTIGWSGLLLVFFGCLLSPLESLKSFDLKTYRTKNMGYIIMTALATLGYTLIDNHAADVIPWNLTIAVRYQVLEMSCAFLFYWFLLYLNHQVVNFKLSWQSWRIPAMIAFLLFSAYSLILWVYQLTPETSYVVALRQFSIVIGVVIAAIKFHEPAPAIRISAAILITVGVFFIAIA